MQIIKLKFNFIYNIVNKWKMSLIQIRDYNNSCDYCGVEYGIRFRSCHFCNARMCYLCGEKIKCKWCGIYPCWDCGTDVTCYDETGPHNPTKLR